MVKYSKNSLWCVRPAGSLCSAELHASLHRDSVFQNRFLKNILYFDQKRSFLKSLSGSKVMWNWSFSESARSPFPKISSYCIWWNWFFFVFVCVCELTWMQFLFGLVVSACVLEHVDQAALLLIVITWNLQQQVLFSVNIMVAVIESDSHTHTRTFTHTHTHTRVYFQCDSQKQSLFAEVNQIYLIIDFILKNEM